MIFKYKGLDVNYLVEGEGEALLLLHGYMEDLTMWSRFVLEFKNQYKVISVDLLGHGDTGNLGYIHSMEDMADCVIQLLTSLRIKSFKVIGHSMGGYVALSILETLSNSVKGIVLLNSTVHADSEERKINRGRAVFALKRNKDGFISMAISNLFTDANRVKFNSEITNLKEKAKKNTIQGLIAAAEGMKIRKSRLQVFNNYKGPKAIVLGDDDPVLGKQSVLFDVDLNCTNIISLKGGHMSFIEDYNNLVTSIKKIF